MELIGIYSSCVECAKELNILYPDKRFNAKGISRASLPENALKSKHRDFSFDRIPTERNEKQ